MRRGLAPLGLALLSLAFLTPSAQSAASPSAAIGAAETIELIEGALFAGEKPSMRVISQSEDHLSIEFELPTLKTQAVELDGVTYHILEIEGGGAAGDAGDPMLPTFSGLIQIPDRAGVSIEVTATETTDLIGYRPFPMQPENTVGFLVNPDAYRGAGVAPAERAGVGAPAIARDLRVVPITFHPVRYSPAQERLEIAQRVEVDVHFTDQDLRNVKEHHRRTIPESFHRLYQSTVVNYSGPGDDQNIGHGTYVIICPDNGSVLSRLEPLIEWRTRKGYEVYVATTSETGTTRDAIRSWLQNKYDTWDNPPEYVALIGDTGGTIALPYFTSGSGESDHPYTQLEGGDLLPDVHIGRISVDSYDRLELVVSKIVDYESDPYMTQTAWYDHAVLLGDPSHSGYTCIQIMQWLKRRLLEWGYADVDTIFADPYVSNFTSKVGEGCSIFCYRGYYNMSSITAGTISGLQNGPKMPFAVNLTCDTGSFASGTSRSEAWLRAGSTSTMMPTGGIGSIGTATIYTHTRYNNCTTYGIWRGIFWEDLFEIGAGLSRGKYELFINYSVRDYNNCSNFIHWNNLMGDPAAEVWTGVPQTMSVSHPSSIALGANGVSVQVTAGIAPCEGAYVCLWKDGETHVGGYTAADGTIALPISTPTTGAMKITVTKHDHRPYLDDIPIQSQNLFVGYESHNIDDDTSGTSSGNGNGVANPNEDLEIPVRLHNFGSQSATSVTAQITTDDPYVTITDDSESYGTISAGASAWGDDDFDITLAPGTPCGHTVQLNLTVSSGSNDWFSLIEIPVAGAAFTYEDVTLIDFGTRIDPGESGQISVEIHNIGNASGTNIVGTLNSDSHWITVTDASGSYGTIGAGSTGENTGNPYAISVAADCFQGHIAPMELLLSFSNGAVDTVNFALSVGQASSDDPTGPDNYGYYAFDNTDTGYTFAPTYDWVEISSVGTDLNLSDDETDQFDLPFPFVYYGEIFTRVSICSNGWIAMGNTPLTNYRNWNIPGAGAPAYLIAPMWDNLYPSGTGSDTYSWYDSANHRLIVQWNNVKNEYGGTNQKFEVILYDPAHHPTETGDGKIVFQFDTFNNSDSQQHYSTTGIQNGDMTDGIMYQYFNYYSTGAATIGSGRAIAFLPLAGLPRGTLTGTITNSSYGNAPLEGIQVQVIETGDQMLSGPDGAYAGGIETGTHTVTATHPSFDPVTYYNVPIYEGQVTVRNFSLTDIAAPQFVGTTEYENTIDEIGPYDISTTIIEYSGLAEIELHYNSNGAGWVSVPMAHQGDNLYLASIPGQPLYSMISYYLSARDTANHTGTDPANAPANTYTFWVMPPVLADNMEAGAGGWTHDVVSSGFNDDWHLSTQRNHTSGGSSSWKFGDTGSGEYSDLADGALVTETFSLSSNAILTFWHWMEAEVSGSFPDHAYDGGLVEISVDGGAWTQITPESGYPYLVREGGTPGPFPAETPIFSGTHDWTEVIFPLEGIEGDVQIRFRFGSDGAVGLEGWFIDDVQIVADEPGFSSAEDLELHPTSLMLHQNMPNPCSVGTQIRFDLPAATSIQLAVFNANGRRVRTLAAGRMPAGRHSISWDGRDEGARVVGSGVYFYTLEAQGRQLSRQLLMIR